MKTEALVKKILEASSDHERFVVAIAGPPGAGKSTLSHDLIDLLPAGSAVAVPMDGFHYDNVVLDQLGMRHCKGAPETFDYQGFAAMLMRIRNREQSIAIPLFDRAADLARAGSALVGDAIKFILVEGNYLLLDEQPWLSLSDYFDFAVFLDVTREELERRLMQRWLGLGYSHQKAHDWVACNDMPNVDRVMARRLTPDFTLSEAK